MEDLLLRFAAATAMLLGAASAHAAEPTADDSEVLDVDAFGPVPFVESEPLLAEMRGILDAPATPKKDLAAGLLALEDWLRHPHEDALARPTGLWLQARLLTALGRKVDARAAWEALATAPGPFSDDARAALADLDEARSPSAAAHWRLTRAPWSPDFLDGAKRAAKDLERLHEAPRAIELLAQALMQGMDPRTRTELVLLLADLYRASDDRAKARDLLLQTWWSEDASAADPALVRSLRALGAAPDKALDLFRQALSASRTAAAALLKKPPRATGPIAFAARALLQRWDDKDAAAALATLPPLPESLAAPIGKRGAKAGREDDDALVTRAIARGMLLRKLDRDADAVAAFLFVHANFPSHPLVHEARDQAAQLLRALGRNDEAEPLDQALLSQSVPGERHRAALWRLGFAAILARQPKVASDYLRQLEWRHGGDPDRYSFCWFERARYWRGRAAQLAGDADTAHALWSSLVDRYPAGWYALVARTRMGLTSAPSAPATPPGHVDHKNLAGWDVGSDDPMATALALYRLGEEHLAQEHFAALLATNQLPGNGRRLLSDLLELAGDSRGAERVLRHAAIPPTMPGDDPDETYYDWYPLRFEDALGDAAKNAGLPSSLLAGIVSVETRFTATARSHAGAIGAAQLLATTGTAIGRKLYGKGFDARQLTDPDVNLSIAARYLADLVAKFQGNTALGVAAYNAGPAPVTKWLAERGQLELDAFVETIPFEQARRYVMRVLSDAEIYRRLYGLDGHPIPLTLTLDRAAKR